MDRPVSTIRRPVKHARLRVREDFRIELVVPADFTQAEVASVLRRKATWIERQLSFFRAHPPAPATDPGTIILFGEPFNLLQVAALGRQVIVDEQEKTVRSGPDLSRASERAKWYRAFAKDYLTKRTGELARKHGFTFGRIFVRAQRNKWGNCSASGNVSLNWRLVMAPRYVSDYLMLHELMHTRIMNHTHRFWVHLKAICPDQQEAIAWLQTNRAPALPLTPGVATLMRPTTDAG
jgi:predicted metal-dependent hydrolase